MGCDKIASMDPETKELLKNTFTLVEENNKLLHKIRGVQKRETLWQIAKIVVILLIAFGFFYYLEPYLNKVIDLYTSVTGIEQNMENAVSGESLKDLLKKL